jgi:hypothetical protein
MAALEDLPEDEQLDEYITAAVRTLSTIPIGVDLWGKLVDRFVEDGTSGGICCYIYKDYFQLCKLLGEIAAANYKNDPAYLKCVRDAIRNCR